MASTSLSWIAVSLLCVQLSWEADSHDLVTKPASDGHGGCAGYAGSESRSSCGVGFIQWNSVMAAVSESDECLSDMSHWCEDKARDSVHPDPCSKDCSTYISCGAGYMHTMPCTSGLVYNPNKNRCDWPREYQCPGVERDDSDLIRPDECRDDMSTFCKDKPRDSLWANPCSEECKGYISCGDGYTYEMSCQPGLVWNPNKNRCDWPREYQCPGVERDDSDLIRPDECRDDMSTFCKDKPRDSLWANPCSEECKGYISCGDGYTYEMSCQPGLVWNPNKNRCDYHHNAMCGQK